jgi:hypothetical protein
VLAAGSSTTSGDPARDRIDTVARDAGWQIVAWYTQLTTAAGADSRPGRRRPAGRGSFRSYNC